MENKTTIDDYSSDAPELTTTDQNEANISSVKNTLKIQQKRINRYIIFIGRK